MIQQQLLQCSQAASTQAAGSAPQQRTAHVPLIRSSSRDGAPMAAEARRHRQSDPPDALQQALEQWLQLSRGSGNCGSGALACR